MIIRSTVEQRTRVSSWEWWSTPLVPAQKYGQAELCESEARLVYIASCRLGNTTERPRLQKEKQAKAQKSSAKK